MYVTRVTRWKEHGLTISKKTRGKHKEKRKGTGRETKEADTYRLRDVPRAIIVQNAKDGTFTLLLRGLHMRAHGGVILLAAAAQIGHDPILLVLLVHPDRSHRPWSVDEFVCSVKKAPRLLYETHARRVRPKVESGEKFPWPSNTHRIKRAF